MICCAQLGARAPPGVTGYGKAVGMQVTYFALGLRVRQSRGGGCGRRPFRRQVPPPWRHYARGSGSMSSDLWSLLHRVWLGRSEGGDANLLDQGFPLEH